MGCGKSSVGRKLSQLLCCPFIDLDDVVEEVAGKSISKIFVEDGEKYFRSLELESLKDILRKESARQWTPLAPSHFVGPSPYAGVRKCQFRPIALPNSETYVSDILSQNSLEGDTAMVLALGGGTVMTPECAELVRKNTCCIYLRTSVDTLLERLSNETNDRPLLSQPSNTSSQEAKYTPSSHGEEQICNPLQERIDELLERRADTYEKTANIVIDTDGKSIEQICLEILG